MKGLVLLLVFVLGIFTIGFFSENVFAADEEIITSTFLGKGEGHEIVIDSSGNVYVVGIATASFPATSGAYDESLSANDAFVAKLNSDLTTVLALTYLGGSSGDLGFGISLDSSGNVYVTGGAGSDFPTTVGAYDTSHNGGSADVFVAKLNGDLTSLLASTFLGGSHANDRGRSIVIDNSGNVYVTGSMPSTDFPTTVGAYDTSHNGAGDVFVAKLNGDLTSLLASTFLGGSNGEGGVDIDLDSSGNVFVTGTAQSGFPTTSGAYDESHNGDNDVFVSKFNSNLTSLLASTFLGGTSNGDAGEALVIDSSGNVYVTGSSDSGFPSTSGAYDETYNGSNDVFVSKFTNDLTSLSASTFIGGENNDIGFGIVIDNSDNIFVTGRASSGFPTSPKVHSVNGTADINNGLQDMFVAKLNKELSNLIASISIGGEESDHGRGIAVDSSDKVYVVGITESSDFTVTSNAIDTTYNGDNSNFVSKFSNNLFTATITTGGGGDTTAPTLGKSATGRQVVENGFSYQSNLGQFAAVNVEPEGNTPFDSLDVGVGPGIPSELPHEIPDEVRDKLNERGLGDVTNTFDNLSEAIDEIGDFVNKPIPEEQSDEAQPDEARRVPPGLERALENLKENLDQSRLDPNTHANPQQATQINNVIDRIAQKIAEIENVMPQDTITDVSDVRRVTENTRFLTHDTTLDELQIKLTELQELQNELRTLLDEADTESSNETGSNVMKLKIKEQKGINGLNFVKIDFGIKEKARDRGVASVVYSPHYDPIANSRGLPQQLITIIDPDNYLNHDNLELTWQGVDCINKGNDASKRQASNYCIEISLAHEFLQATDYDIVGLTVVDRSGNVAYSYFNHGINVQGESLVPPKTEMIVEQGKPPKHIEITLQDRINDLWQDENQNVYTRNSFGTWLKITHEELHDILGQENHHDTAGENNNFKPVGDEYVHPDDNTIGVNGIKRINQHFAEYAYEQELIAMKVWDGTLIQSEMPEAFETVSYGAILGSEDPTLRINDAALQKDILKQSERALQKLNAPNHSLEDYGILVVYTDNSIEIPEEILFIKDFSEFKNSKLSDIEKALEVHDQKVIDEKFS